MGRGRKPGGGREKRQKKQRAILIRAARKAPRLPRQVKQAVRAARPEARRGMIEDFLKASGFSPTDSFFANAVETLIQKAEAL